MQAELRSLSSQEYRLDMWSDWFEETQVLRPEQVRSFFQLAPFASDVDAFLREAVPGQALRILWGKTGVKTCTEHVPLTQTRRAASYRAA